MKQFSFTDVDNIVWNIEIHYPLEDNLDSIHTNFETIVFKSKNFNISCTHYIPPIGTLFNIIPSTTNLDGSKNYGNITYAGDFLVSIDPNI